ncbi:MGMT family protein [Candidatus Berkelbacteria bacterium]|nr:MGMT family protein [Candidatus Berkelbacteria bacterium]
MSSRGDFQDRVYATVRSIPAGQVLTYGEVAARAGHPGSARAVGSLMRANHKSFLTHPDDPTAIPCHRVVASAPTPLKLRGARYRVGGFNGGTWAKIQLLTAEGWQIQHGRLEPR